MGAIFDLHRQGGYAYFDTQTVIDVGVSLSSLTTTSITQTGARHSLTISNAAAGTLYLAVYPSAAPVPTWDRTTGWSGSPVYTDADTSPETSGSYTFVPDSSGLAASTAYVWYAVWDDGTDTVGPVASGVFSTLADATTASGAITERADTASGTASLSWPAITASGAAQERRDAAAGLASLIYPPIVATGAALELRDIVAGVAVSFGVITASGAVVERGDVAWGRIGDPFVAPPSYRIYGVPSPRRDHSINQPSRLLQVRP